MKQATDIMNFDNFPSSIELRQETFLLHPNSLHFIFHLNKINKITTYTSDQIKYYFFAFLTKRNLLTTSIYTYIMQYWKDIIRLVHEWSHLRTNGQVSTTKKSRYVECKEKQIKPSENRTDLEDELQADPSIVAYEIACYLKSCIDHFQIKIIPA